MKQHPQDHSDHQTLHHQDPKITAKQFAAQLKHPALQPAHSPMKAQSPNPSVPVHFSTPSPSLPGEGKNENFHSLFFLLFVNSFTAHITEHPNKSFLLRLQMLESQKDLSLFFFFLS